MCFRVWLLIGVGLYFWIAFRLAGVWCCVVCFRLVWVFGVDTSLLLRWLFAVYTLVAWVCLLNDVLFWGFGDACWLLDLIVVLCYLVVGDGFDGWVLIVLILVRFALVFGCFCAVFDVLG